jgi:hypothetical protein
VAATVECARQHCEDIFTGSASNLSDATTDYLNPIQVTCAVCAIIYNGFR